jgi:hypothetical protein
MIKKCVNSLDVLFSASVPSSEHVDEQSSTNDLRPPPTLTFIQEFGDLCLSNHGIRHRIRC